MEVENETLEKVENDVEIDKKTTKIKGIVFHLIAILCIVIFCAALAPKTLQNDTFYTIKIGEYIYNNGVDNLTEDIYSWHELPYTYPHWLYDLMVFIIYNSFGHLGVYISTMAFTAILGVSVYALCNIKSKNKVVSFIITVLAIYLMRDFLAARAQLVTFILFAWAVICIEKLLKTEKKIYALFLILIPILITNLHCAVFPFYFILFLPYIGEYLLLVIEDWDLDIRLYRRLFKIRAKLSRKADTKERCINKVTRITEALEERKQKRFRLRERPYKIVARKNNVVLLLIAVMAVAALTGFLNPAGDGAYTYLIKTLQGNTTSSINEHLPLTLSEAGEFGIALITFLLILVFTDTKIKLHDLFMLGGIVFLAFNSRRQVSMFAIFCGPILATLIADMINKYDKETFEKIHDFVATWFGAIVVLCSFIILSTNTVKPHLRADYVDESAYPVEAADWILANLDVGELKLYNEYNYGSYLLFRGIPVFIDSRCDLYSPEFNGDLDNGIDGRDIFSDALNIPGLAVNYENMFSQYGVTHIILYENSKLAMVLVDDPDYTCIYSEGNFKIFERLSASSDYEG